jgi:RHS repeat-associated protein
VKMTWNMRTRLFTARAQLVLLAVLFLIVQMVVFSADASKTRAAADKAPPDGDSRLKRRATDDRSGAKVSLTGLQVEEIIGTNGKRTLTYPDGTVITLTPGADPRFGMQSPLEASLTIRTPTGLTYSRAQTRAVTLSNPNDPLSLVTETDTFNLNGRTYTSLYTAASRTFTNTTPAGRQTLITTDIMSRITQRQFANLNPATYTYDARGRLFTSTFGTASQTRAFGFGYNSQGYLSSLTDPFNRVQSFSYDLAGRVIQQTLPGGRQIGYTRDFNGNLTSITPPGRPAHSLTFTAAGLLETYTPPDAAGVGANQTVYSYNFDRQLTSLTRPDSLTLDFAYDGAGRVNTLTIPDGQYLYTYNTTTGNLASLNAPGGSTLTYSYDGLLFTGTTWAGPLSGSVERTYDNNFRITSLSLNGSNPINFAYDNDSLLTNAGSLTLTRNAQNGLLTATSLSNVTDTWGDNDFAEPMSYSAAFSGSALYSVQHNRRDNLGRITQKTETIGGVTDVYDYTYDPLTGWLTGVRKNSVTVATYSYDSNGNRLSYTGAGPAVTGAYDNQDRLTQYGATVYAYTANGELLSKTQGGQITAYQNDVLGNLRTVTLADNTQIEYLIDGQNRRIGKRVNGTLVQGFLYQSQLNVIAELDGSNTVVSRFIYGVRRNVPDYMIKGSVTYRIISDHLGSPRLVVDVATGAIAQRLDYDEFGVVLLDTNPGFQPFGFVGGIYDTHTKLVRFGARDYDAETGRWTAKDPILFAGGDINLYRYALNDPVNRTDPTGLWEPSPWDSIMGGLGAVVAAGEIGALPVGAGVFAGELAAGGVVIPASAAAGVVGAGLAGYGIGTLGDYLASALEDAIGFPLTPGSLACTLTSCDQAEGEAWWNMDPSPASKPNSGGGLNPDDPCFETYPTGAAGSAARRASRGVPLPRNRPRQ